MGKHFAFTAVAENEDIAQQAIAAGIAEIERIDALIAFDKPTSYTHQINQQAGIAPVKVDQEVFDLLQCTRVVSKKSNGAFDISFASIERIWKFDGSMTALPDPNLVERSVEKINWKKIILNKNQQTVYLKEKGMEINFGGINKGYAAQKAKAVMEKIGAKGGLIDAEGDLLAWGVKANGNRWKINIANPKQGKPPIAWLNITNLAVATSGDYDRFAMIDGVRYAHIIDVRTGYPVTEVKSVTVVGKDADLVDALSTAVFVLGPGKGIKLINRMNDIECLVVDVDDNLLISDGLLLNYY